MLLIKIENVFCLLPNDTQEFFFFFGGGGGVGGGGGWLFSLGDKMSSQNILNPFSALS